MNFDLLDEQEMPRDSVARFVRDAYPSDARRALAGSAEGSSREHWRQYAEFGWLGLSLPEDVGGLGCSFVDVAGNAGRFVGANCIQLHGGNGMSEEYAIGRYFKRLVAIEKLFGDTDQHLARVAST